MQKRIPEARIHTCRLLELIETRFGQNPTLLRTVLIDGYVARAYS